MDQSDESKLEPFKVSINSTKPLELILLQLTYMRAELSALVVMTLNFIAAASDESIEDVSARYEVARKECLLRIAFELQDNEPQSPEQQG